MPASHKEDLGSIPGIPDGLQGTTSIAWCDSKTKETSKQKSLKKKQEHSRYLPCRQAGPDSILGTPLGHPNPPGTILECSNSNKSELPSGVAPKPKKVKKKKTQRCTESK